MSDQSRAAGGVGAGVGGGAEMLMTEQTGVEGERAVLISRESEHLGAHANEQESVVGEQMPMEAAQPVGEVRPVTGEEAQEVWDADIYAYMHTFISNTRARAHTHTDTHTPKNTHRSCSR